MRIQLNEWILSDNIKYFSFIHIFIGIELPSEPLSMLYQLWNNADVVINRLIRFLAYACLGKQFAFSRMHLTI